MDERDPTAERRRREAAVISSQALLIIQPGMLLVTVGLALGATSSPWVTVGMTLAGVVFVAGGTAWTAHRARKALRRPDDAPDEVRPPPPS